MNLPSTYSGYFAVCGDRVKDIPRKNFFVSEDNHTWDMDEPVE